MSDWQAPYNLIPAVYSRPVFAIHSATLGAFTKAIDGDGLTVSRDAARALPKGDDAILTVIGMQAALAGVGAILLHAEAAPDPPPWAAPARKGLPILMAGNTTIEVAAEIRRQATWCDDDGRHLGDLLALSYAQGLTLPVAHKLAAHVIVNHTREYQPVFVGAGAVAHGLTMLRYYARRVAERTPGGRGRPSEDVAPLRALQRAIAAECQRAGLQKKPIAEAANVSRSILDAWLADAAEVS